MKVSELIYRLQRISGDPTITLHDAEIDQYWTRVTDIAEVEGAATVLIEVAP